MFVGNYYMKKSHLKNNHQVALMFYIGPTSCFIYFDSEVQLDHTVCAR